VSTSLLQKKAQAAVAPASAPPQRAPIEIGRTDDPTEHEADRVAAQLLRTPEPVDLRGSPAATPAGSAPPIVHDVLSAPGRPLDATTRGYFEPRLGTDLSDVRIHDDNRAAQSANAVDAHAYTVGNHIAFAAGGHTPGAPESNELLAHELVHVAQQRGSSAAPRSSVGVGSRRRAVSASNTPLLHWQRVGPQSVRTPRSYGRLMAELEAREREQTPEAERREPPMASPRAVTQMLSRAPKAPTPKAPTPKAPAKGPQVDGWMVEVTPGPLGAGIDRKPDIDVTKVFLGDTVTVRADFVRITEADHERIGWGTVYGGAHLDIPSPKGFETETVLKWDVRPKKVGTERVTFSVDTEVSPSKITETFLVVTDLQDFTLGCIEAQSTLSGKFHTATRKLNEAATAFREASGDQEKVLNQLSASDKMLEDVTWGVLFAAAGGYAGSRLGTSLKEMKSLTAVDAKGDAQQLLSDAVIDAAKDTGKFVVRAADRLRGPSSGPSGKGDSTQHDVKDPIRSGGGTYHPAGEHPQDFLTKLSSRVAAEGEAAQAVLTKLIHEAKEARRASSKADFDEDPVAVVSRDRTLDELANELVTKKEVYLARLWEAWVKDHGWQTVPVLDAIRAAAKAVGEDGNDWIPVIHPVEMKRQPGQGPIRPL